LKSILVTTNWAPSPSGGVPQKRGELHAERKEKALKTTRISYDLGNTINLKYIWG